MAAERPLRLIDPESGEIVETCPRCAQTREDFENLQRKFKYALREIRALKNERAREAKEHPRLSEVKQIFDLWRDLCRHPKSKLDTDRSWLILDALEKYSLDVCLRAVRGAAFEPYVTRRKNGSTKRHDGIDLIFRNAAKVEDFACRAPTLEMKAGPNEPREVVDPVPSDPAYNMPAVIRRRGKA